MEEVTGSHQKKRVLVLFKKMLHHHGILRNQERFLNNMLRKLLKSLQPSILLKLRELLPPNFWMTMISERHSTRRLELELDRLLCKEEDLPHNTGMHHHHQRKMPLQVLLKKRKRHHHHGTQQNLEEFLINMSKKLLKSLQPSILLKLRELLLPNFWMTTTSERHSTRRLELELDRLLCKEEVLPHNTGMNHQLQRKMLVVSSN